MTRNTDDTSGLTIVFVIIGALLVLPSLFMGFGMMGGGHMMGGMWGGGMMWGDGTVPGWMMLLGILVQLVYVGAILGAGYLVYRALVDDGTADPAVEELRLAYARGDLTEEEYESRRDALEHDS